MSDFLTLQCCIKEAFKDPPAVQNKCMNEGV